MAAHIRQAALADLHLHSSFSDGLYTPRALCAMAAKKKLTYLSLCDHDTLAGLPDMEEAVREQNRELEQPLTLIPGVEVSTGEDGLVHILGYGVNPRHAPLRDWLCAAQLRRKNRFFEMIAKLDSLGISVPGERLPSLEGGLPAGRAHLARILVELGAVHTTTQAFDRYLGEGKPAYVPYERSTAAEAVRFLREVGCVPVLAHPARMRVPQEQRLAMITALQHEGLMGVEVFHPSASKRDIRELFSFARRQGLLVTGGSDFHGDRDTAVALGKLPSGWTTLSQDVQALHSALVHP